LSTKRKKPIELENLKGCAALKAEYDALFSMVVGHIRQTGEWRIKDEHIARPGTVVHILRRYDEATTDWIFTIEGEEPSNGQQDEGAGGDSSDTPGSGSTEHTTEPTSGSDQ
jgi:hypothetical protein